MCVGEGWHVWRGDIATVRSRRFAQAMRLKHPRARHPEPMRAHALLAGAAARAPRRLYT